MAADPASKLRTVLDYVPCEACLAEPVEHQELLCSVCRRLDRQVGVRIAVSTTVLLERPSEPAPAAPVVIPPPAPDAPPTVPAAVVLFVPEGAELPAPTSGLEVLVTPLSPSRPEPVVEPDFDDIVTFAPPVDAFDYVRPAPPASPPPSPPPPEEQDDLVFRPPPAEPEPEREPAPADAPAEDWMPSEEADAPQPERAEDDDAWTRAGVPADAARALVASGFASPEALVGQDADEVVTRVRGITGAELATDDVRRWQAATT